MTSENTPIDNMKIETINVQELSILLRSLGMSVCFTETEIMYDNIVIVNIVVELFKPCHSCTPFSLSFV
jgi:hypothetical protein